MASSSATSLVQSSTLPPAQPAYVLRGHTAQVHAVHFFRDNLRLITGDADGWVVLWDLPTRRAVAVWKAHVATILGLQHWGQEKIITHGRDSKLNVWQMRPEDEALFSKVTLIEDTPTTERKQPWLLHTLHVSTVNFCSFSTATIPSTGTVIPEDPILVATAGVQDGTVALNNLPSEIRHSVVPAPRDVKTGMLMAVGIRYDDSAIGAMVDVPVLTVMAGYESGHAALWRLNTSSRWEAIYVLKHHSQPVLSLSIASKADYWFTSSADAIITRCPLQASRELDVQSATKTIQTRHAGQQGISIRSDEKIFATAGWDGRVRVYAVKTMRELAVLKWHREGCYALAFADVQGSHDPGEADHRGQEGQGAERILTVAEQRKIKTTNTHWLAAGSKDGKVSLWDIY